MQRYNPSVSKIDGVEVMKLVVVSNQSTKKPGVVVNPVVRNFVVSMRDYTQSAEFLVVDVINDGFFAYAKLFVELSKRKLGDERKEDVVYHVHFGGIQALLVALFQRSNSVISFHGTDLHGGTPSSLLGRMKSKLNVFCSRLASRLAGATTVVSPNLLAHLPKSVQSTTRVIPTGVDLQMFYPVEKSVAVEKLGLESEKRYLLFSDISNSVVKRRDIADLVIQKLNQDLENIELLVMSKVAFEYVPDFINASDLVLIVSDKEGSPSVVKEALSCGVPIASVDVGDVWFYTREEKNCLMLNSQDPNQIATEIKELLESTSLPRFDAKNWQQRLDIKSICKSYHEIYEKLRIE